MPGDRGAPSDPSTAAGAMDGERMLAEALAAEASKAAKHSKDPFADLGVKFVEARLPCTGLMSGVSLWLCLQVEQLCLVKLEKQVCSPAQPCKHASTACP